MQKQVEKKHYIFSKYLHKRRWASIWHQLDEVSKLSHQSILEIGPGPGTFKLNATALGIYVETVDLDPELKPDHIASVVNLPFRDQSYEIVCAFQMLEHIPFGESITGFAEMCRVAKNNVIISLPDAKVLYNWQINLPRFGSYCFSIPKITIGLKNHFFDGEHYWEINKKKFSLKKVSQAFLLAAPNFRLVKTYRVVENPYHRFFIFERHE
jgi:hypothetical protein